MSNQRNFALFFMKAPELSYRTKLSNASLFRRHVDKKRREITALYYIR